MPIAFELVAVFGIAFFRRNALSQFADEFRIQRMAGTTCDNVTAQVAAKQGDVAENVEHLVPGGFIGEPGNVVDGPARPKDQDVGGRKVQSHSRPMQLERFGFEKESAARRQVARVRLRRDRLSVFLSFDGRVGTIVEEVADAKFIALGGMQSDAGASLLYGDGFADGPNASGGALGNDAGAAKDFRELPRRSIETRRFGPVQFDVAIVDAHPAEGGEHVFHKRHAVRQDSESGSAMRVGDEVSASGNDRGSAKVGADEYGSGVRRGRTKSQSHMSAGEKTGTVKSGLGA